MNESEYKQYLIDDLIENGKGKTRKSRPTAWYVWMIDSGMFLGKIGYYYCLTDEPVRTFTMNQLAHLIVGTSFLADFEYVLVEVFDA